MNPEGIPLTCCMDRWHLTAKAAENDIISGRTCKVGFSSPKGLVLLNLCFVFVYTVLNVNGSSPLTNSNDTRRLRAIWFC